MSIKRSFEADEFYSWSNYDDYDDDWGYNWYEPELMSYDLQEERRIKLWKIKNNIKLFLKN